MNTETAPQTHMIQVSFLVPEAIASHLINKAEECSTSKATEIRKRLYAGMKSCDGITVKKHKMITD